MVNFGPSAKAKNVPRFIVCNLQVEDDAYDFTIPVSVSDTAFQL